MPEIAHTSVPSVDPASETAAAPLPSPSKPSDLLSLKAAFGRTRTLNITVDGDPYSIEYRRHNRRESEMVHRVIRRTVVKRNAEGAVDLLHPEAEQSKRMQQRRADALSIYIGWQQIRQEIGTHVDLEELADNDSEIDKVREFLESNFPEFLLIELRTLIEAADDGVARLAQGF